jgi:uncharacterized protein YpmS
MTVNNQRNWKRAFFILLASILFILTVMVGMSLYLLFSEPTTPSKSGTGNEEQSFFTLSTTKSAITKWINEEISKREEKIENINYEVLIEDHIYLQGNLIVFNRELPFRMTFDPYVNEDKGLTLREREIRLGNLQLPGDVVLALIQQQINFPDWVYVNPSRQEIIVNVKEIDLNQGMQLSVEEFNLENDQLEFNIKR